MKCTIYIAMSVGFGLSALAQVPAPTDPKSIQDGLALWNKLKAQLQSQDGDNYFKSGLQNALVPGGTNGVHALMGTVVSSQPPEHPNEFVLAISDKIHPEVTLKFMDKPEKDGQFKGPIAPGARILFAGVVTAFTKDPFMLTFSVGAGDGPGATFAVIVEAQEDSFPNPVISVNYPSRLSTRFVNIDLYRLPRHEFTVNENGVSTELFGVHLVRFLETAGWHSDPLKNPVHYAVEVTGVQSVVTLEVSNPGSFEQQAWLVAKGKPESKPEASLVVVTAGGTLIQRVEGIQRILVSEKQ